MQWILYPVVFVAGLSLTVQVGLNATLRKSLGEPGVATLVSFLVGTAALVVFLVLTRATLPTREAIATAPVWAWGGGLLGAFYVAVALIGGPRLGAATLLAVTVLGQLAASLVVDHFGWLGFAQQPISLTRIAGAALLLAGVGLIVR